MSTRVPVLQVNRGREELVGNSCKGKRWKD